MRVLTLLILATFCQASNADVFKCLGNNGRASYQPSPCTTAAEQQQLDIQSDPAKDAEAKARLEEVRSEYESRKTARLKAENKAIDNGKQNRRARNHIAQRAIPTTASRSLKHRRPLHRNKIPSRIIHSKRSASNLY